MPLRALGQHGQGSGYFQLSWYRQGNVCYVVEKGKAALGVAGEDTRAACRQDYIRINQVNVLYAVNTDVFRRGMASLCDGRLRIRMG